MSAEVKVEREIRKYWVCHGKRCTVGDWDISTPNSVIWAWLLKIRNHKGQNLCCQGCSFSAGAIEIGEMWREGCHTFWSSERYLPAKIHAFVSTEI